MYDPQDEDEREMFDPDGALAHEFVAAWSEFTPAAGVVAGLVVDGAVNDAITAAMPATAELVEDAWSALCQREVRRARQVEEDLAIGIYESAHGCPR